MTPWTTLRESRMTARLAEVNSHNRKTVVVAAWVYNRRTRGSADGGIEVPVHLVNGLSGCGLDGSSRCLVAPVRLAYR